jgi:hypothetical protein
MTPEQFLPVLFSLSGSVYRDEIKTFLSKRWQAFRRARTNDLMILTRRSLGPDDKFSLPDPMFNELVKTVAELSVLAAIGWLLRKHQEFLWVLRIGYFAVVLRLYFVLALFVGYRLKLLPESFCNLTENENCVWPRPPVISGKPKIWNIGDVPHLSRTSISTRNGNARTVPLPVPLERKGPI